MSARRISVSQLRDHMAGTLELTRISATRFIIFNAQRKHEEAALVPVEDLRRLEALERAMMQESRDYVERARAADTLLPLEDAVVALKTERSPGSDLPPPALAAE